MLRIILQRLAVQRRIAEQLEAVSLDEVLRRMQSSSLTNPARSLEAHFVLATERRDHERAAPTAASPCAETLREPSDDLLRDALSERLLAEVRRDLSSPTITLDDGGLMLANCLRHGLSPLATQQVFALWQRRMHHATTGASSAAAPRTSISMLGMGKSKTAFARAGGGAAGVSDLAQFQSLVRVMEACLDAHDKQQRELSRFRKRTSSAAAADARKIQSKSSIAFTLDDLAALVDTVEQHWTLFIDHGTSTTGLLVQFTALALVLTGCASSAAAEAEPGSKFANSLRRLSHLQTDRALLQQRIFGLCDQAIVSLCSQEEEAAAAGDGGIPSRRESLWWYRPQELVRLSQAMRLIEVYEVEQRRGSRYSSGTGSPVEHSSHGEGDGPRRPGSSVARTSRRDAGKTMSSSSNPVRGTPPSRAQTAPVFPKARWLLRLPTTWWPASSTSLHGVPAEHRKTEAAARARRRLGAYVTHHALQHTSTVTPPPVPSYAVSPALASISLADVEDIFAVVCATASSVASTEAVTAFSWWVRDVFFQQHRHRSLHDVQEMAGLLGIAEVCVAYPDGTQTVLAEALKCLQRSALVLWCVGDTAVTSGPDTPGMLWSRACEVVGDALALATVRAEAQRTLRALVHTVSQHASSCIVTREPSSELARRHQRYGLLVLACLQLQSPDGIITPALKRMILELVFSAPFRRDDADHGGPAAVARALFLFTRPEPALREPASTQGVPRRDRVIPHLLNELTRLVSPAAAALDDGATAAVEDGGGSAQLLQQLTSAERQMLRSALQEVRLQTQHEMKERPLWGPMVAPSSSEAGPGQAARTASLQLPLSLPVTAQVGVVSSADASTSSSDRQAGAMGAKSGLGRACTECHARTPRHRMRASEEHLLIQSEIDTLTRYLRQRRSPG
ncbi:conserved hypothetical protein [Leishmania major strain Friedlin]|uniref:Uncharacterized protein n=1 Tax=Leishmania major TaxID=5664 RepID=Q4QHG3_LEIMA|nr:conserved hypothetical protein [Leishmania major strain Friedlin]CAG9570033.1 hypothetical_protein_-_conserved [Leishmania major strain Friedlin]CAJ02634.1 conserved hypothetical protein [Leishmania major strain Friedlin]|eukprot:XP_001681385.1 conserved hypothetical protein [Leishmania major strain Friedlin]